MNSIDNLNLTPGIHSEGLFPHLLKVGEKHFFVKGAVTELAQMCRS